MTTKVQVAGLGEFARTGFTLEHYGCEVVLLLHDGKLVARFSQIGTTERNIQEECAAHLVTKHSWDGALWKKEANDDREGNRSSTHGKSTSPSGTAAAGAA